MASRRGRTRTTAYCQHRAIGRRLSLDRQLPRENVSVIRAQSGKRILRRGGDVHLMSQGRPGRRAMSASGNRLNGKNRRPKHTLKDNLSGGLRRMIRPTHDACI